MSHNTPGTRGRVPSALWCALAGAFAGGLMLAACGGTAVTNESTARTDWSYHGETGPENWGNMNPDWAVAKTGREQSPVDIATANVVPDAGLSPLVFDYHASARASAGKATIVNNGHTVQVNLPSGNTVTFGGTAYDLLQFHFHAPSEHSIDGKLEDMEAHLVHKSAAGKLLVVGVLLRNGTANDLISKVLAAAPATPSHRGRAEGNEVEASFPINPEDLLPANRAYYTLPGSLTTPPCTEGVTWILMQALGQVDATSTSKMLELFGGSTNRPVQPLYERVIRSGG